jgi:alpha-tubulin suppressor-like RCC1 family protein
MRGSALCRSRLLPAAVALLVAGCGGGSGPTSPTAAKLAFSVQPSTTAAGHAITPAVQVAVQDAQGKTLTSASASITLAIGTNPVGGTLSGTAPVAAVNGVATFSNLSIDSPGSGYTLTAFAGGLNGMTSAAFTVSGFAAVSAGAYDSCGLTTAGAAYCWGQNGNGQLGNGLTTSSSTPVAVSGGLTFAAVSVGNDHSCGLTTAGGVYCWGWNGDGQLGNSSTTSSSTPVAVSGGLVFAAVSAGYGHSCGLTTGGAAYCWGQNGDGQLGNSSTTSSSTPVAVSGGLVFAAVSAGNGHSCGLTTAGAGYCWGDNVYGELGNGTTTGPQQCGTLQYMFPCSTTPVVVSSGLTFAAVIAGAFHSCGLTTAGAAYCWGFNMFGQLGNGSTTDSSTPVAVSGGLTLAAVSVGRDVHSCSVTTAGAAYCWGYNGNGQLGNGSTTNSSTPVAVSGGLTFSAVSVGDAHSCGLTTAGAAYCWGYNVAGQLGNGSTTNSPTPVRVSNP